MRDFWERTSFLGHLRTNSFDIFKLKTKQRSSRRHTKTDEEKKRDGEKSGQHKHGVLEVVKLGSERVYSPISVILISNLRQICIVIVRRSAK